MSELQPPPKLSCKIGNVVFKEPVPNDISISTEDGKSMLLIDEGEQRFNDLPVGSYKLVSDSYVVRNNTFKIKHRRTTKSSPDYYTIKDITDKRDYYLNRRKLYLQMLAAGVSYRSYLGLRSSYLYDQYSKNTEKADERHRKIENIDKQKPLFDVLSGISVFD